MLRKPRISTRWPSETFDLAVLMLSPLLSLFAGSVFGGKPRAFLQPMRVSVGSFHGVKSYHRGSRTAGLATSTCTFGIFWIGYRVMQNFRGMPKPKSFLTRLYLLNRHTVRTRLSVNICLVSAFVERATACSIPLSSLIFFVDERTTLL